MPGKHAQGIHGMPGVPGMRGMSDTGERTYAYAKACGIIGKSFIGKRISSLEGVNRLSELDRIIFPDSAQILPEKELLVDLEDRIIEREIKSILSIVGCFSKPPEFLNLLVRGYEYADLKNALTASLEGETAAPAHIDIGRFQTVRFSAWPDIPAMIKGTEFDFLLEQKDLLSQGQRGIGMQTALDRHYYSALWGSLASLSAKDRLAVEKILADEISLKNCGWALRLRTYYRMPAEEVRSHLIDIPAKEKRPLHSKSAAKTTAKTMAKTTAKLEAKTEAKHAAKSLADEAIASLDFPLDSFEAWSSWRWKEFVNPQAIFESSEPALGDTGLSSRRGGYWQADPRYFQNAASRYLYRLARHYFRLRPFSLDSIFCFIKLKQFEEDILTSCSEGLGLGIHGRDIISVLGVGQ